MSHYLDTNVLVSFFARDEFSERAEAFLTATRGPFVISDLTAVEFSAVIARQVRIRERPRGDAAAIFGEFDTWCGDSAERVAVATEHFALADQYLRRLTLALSAPDAIHIAVAHRSGSALVTFDRQMATAARRLNLIVAAA
ncbi:MAG TPA: type II toxin-antitoxin system VapC family toxin [Stellaceae bacterium]|nr:type II toxin-antitoxin system VapC family toxin [Stellaceae bacterium]